MAIEQVGCTLAVCDGRVEGRVIAEEHGGGGFGYDSMFIPDGHAETFGVLPADVKNGLSHRARALAKAAVILAGLPV
jgi:XTP/dITP diphosphohydrolase